MIREQSRHMAARGTRAARGRRARRARGDAAAAAAAADAGAGPAMHRPPVIRIRDERGPFGLPCALCGHHGRGPAHVRFLPHGIHVWLCAVHGSLAFLTRNGGREFARRLQLRWEQSAAFGPRRRLALNAHLDRVRLLGAAADKPGSHSWPRLRRDAERRFAAGDDPATVIHELRVDVAGGSALAPSLRTFRRWFAEGRWLIPEPEPAAQVPTSGPPPRTTNAPPHDVAPNQRE